VSVWKTYGGKNLCTEKLYIEASKTYRGKNSKLMVVGHRSTKHTYLFHPSRFNSSFDWVFFILDDCISYIPRYNTV